MALKKRRKPRSLAFLDTEDVADAKRHRRGLPNCRMRTLMWWVCGRTARVARNRYEKPGTKRPMNVFFSYRVWLDRIFPYISTLRPLHQKVMSKFASACWASCDSAAQTFWRTLQEPGQRRWESAHPDYRYKPRTKAQIEADRAARKTETDKLRREKYFQKKPTKGAGKHNGHIQDMSDGRQTPATVCSTAEDPAASKSSISPQDDDRTEGSSKPRYPVVPRFRPRFHGMTAPLYRWLDEFPPLAYADAEDEAAQAAAAAEQLPAVEVVGVGLDQLGLTEPPSPEVIVARMRLFQELGRDPTGAPLYPDAYPAAEPGSSAHPVFPSDICARAAECGVDLQAAISGSNLHSFPRPTIVSKPSLTGSSPSTANPFLTPITSSSPAYSADDSMRPSPESTGAVVPLALKRKRADSDMAEERLAGILSKRMRGHGALPIILPEGQTDVFWDESHPTPIAYHKAPTGKGKEPERSEDPTGFVRADILGGNEEDEDDSDWVSDDEESAYQKHRAEIRAKWAHHWAHDSSERTEEDAIHPHHCDISLPADRFSDYEEITPEQLDALEQQFVQSQNDIGLAADAELQKHKMPRKGKAKAATTPTDATPQAKLLPARKQHRELQESAIVQRIRTAAGISKRNSEISAELDSAEVYRKPSKKNGKSKARDADQADGFRHDQERLPVAREDRRSASPMSRSNGRQDLGRTPPRTARYDPAPMLPSSAPGASVPSPDMVWTPPINMSHAPWLPPPTGFWYNDGQVVDALFFGSLIYPADGQSVQPVDDMLDMNLITELAPLPDEATAFAASGLRSQIFDRDPLSGAAYGTAEYIGQDGNHQQQQQRWLERLITHDAAGAQAAQTAIQSNVGGNDEFDALAGHQGLADVQDELLWMVLKEHAIAQGVHSVVDTPSSSEPGPSASHSSSAAKQRGIRRVTQQFLGLHDPDTDELLSLQLQLSADLDNDLTSTSNLTSHLPAPAPTISTAYPIPSNTHTYHQQPVRFPPYPQHDASGPSRPMRPTNDSISPMSILPSPVPARAPARTRLPFDPTIHDPRLPVQAEPLSFSQANHLNYQIPRGGRPADTPPSTQYSGTMADTGRGDPDPSAVLAASSLLSLRSSTSGASPRRVGGTWERG